jgi:hypothetical protein
MNRANFGRRAAPRSSQPALPVLTKFSRPAPGIVRAPETPAVAVDDEIKAWKKSRGPSPYLKPLAVMASLCFGVASVALPDAVNEFVRYPLYLLSAVSLYAGFHRKHIAGKS